jgi:hypothetical protein
MPQTGSVPRSFPTDAGFVEAGIVGISGVMRGAIGALPSLAMKRSGSASNLAAQPAQQK